MVIEYASYEPYKYETVASTATVVLVVKGGIVWLSLSLIEFGLVV